MRHIAVPSINVIGSVLAVIAVAICSASCAHQLTFQVQKHPNREGVYLLYYTSWGELLDKYGRGEENVRNDSRAVAPGEAEAIWQKAYGEAAIRYLESNGVIPGECKNNGVVIISSGQYENGSGSTAFRCK
jgi:hypothetical protein